MQKSNNPKTKPWRDKSIEEIKEISKSWSQEQWEEYLSDQEAGLREEFLGRTPIEEAVSTQDYAGILFGIEEYSTLGKVVIQQALTQLTHLEREVLRKTYWDGMSQREIAEELNCSRRSIRDALTRGHNKTKKLIESGEIVEKLRATSSLFHLIEKESSTLPKILIPEIHTPNRLQTPGKRPARPLNVLAEEENISEVNI